MFDTLPGLFIGIADSLLLLLYRVSRPHTAVLGHVPGSRAIVLDCETVPFADVTAARMVNQVTADLQRQGVRLVVARDIGQVRDMLALTGQANGTPEYFGSVQEAVTAVRPRPSGGPETG